MMTMRSFENIKDCVVIDSQMLIIISRPDFQTRLEQWTKHKNKNVYNSDGGFLWRASICSIIKFPRKCCDKDCDILETWFDELLPTISHWRLLTSTKERSDIQIEVDVRDKKMNDKSFEDFIQSILIAIAVATLTTCVGKLLTHYYFIVLTLFMIVVLIGMVGVHRHRHKPIPAFPSSSTSFSKHNSTTLPSSTKSLVRRRSPSPTNLASIETSVRHRSRRGGVWCQEGNVFGGVGEVVMGKKKKVRSVVRKFGRFQLKWTHSTGPWRTFG